MIEGDFEPGFYIKHFIKDMNIALEEAGCDGDGNAWTFSCKKMYEHLAENGEENSGTHALYKYWQ